MKRFLVGFCYTEKGSKIIEAESEDKAEKQLYEELELNGVESIKPKELNSREYDTWIE